MRSLSLFKLGQISKHLHNGGLIAYPTEAVYGLGCNPNNQRAVYNLLELKQRSPAKGLILIASSIEQLLPYIEPVSAEINAKLLSTWPGPVTWLLPAKQQTPKWLTGTHTTLACRVSDHPLVKQLCSAFNGALVSTSANIAQQKPCKSATQVRKQFNQHRQLIIIPGHLGDLKQPTRIFNALNDTQIR